MEKFYLLGEKVIFSVNKHQLIPKNSNATPVQLNTPASRCLLLLIENQGQTVGKEVFFEEIWQKEGSYVSANTLYQNISLLRKGLKTAGLDDTLVKTVPRQGLTLSYDITVTPCTYEPQLEQHSGPINDVEDLTPAPEIRSGPKIKALLFAALLVVTAICLGIYLWSDDQGGHYFQHYKPLQTNDKCTVYIPRNTTDISSYQRFSTKNIRCQNNQLVYLTKNAMPPHTSAIFCEPEDDELVACHTDYYIGE